MATPSRITGTRYVLAVKNLAASAEYYQKNLGFVSEWVGDGWHFLSREKFIVMLGECPDDRSAFETVNHSYFAYVDVENIDALYMEFLSRDAGVTSIPENKPWGQREFGVCTIDGHRITFGAKIP